MSAKVPGKTLARVFWRCLFLQAAWNRRGMQNLGFAYAIDPALRALTRRGPARGGARAPPAASSTATRTWRRRSWAERFTTRRRWPPGPSPGRQPLQYKQTLQGPLAAIGDGFFWTALRPFFGAVAALGALLLGWPAIVLTIAVYNAIHLALRVRLFRAGYERATPSSRASPGSPCRSRRTGCAPPGGGLRRRGGGRRGAQRRRSPGRLRRVAAVVAALGYAALARGARLLPTAYAAALFGVAAAVAVGRLHGSS